MEDIVNRIANSSLITIDLEDYYPAGERTVLDIKDWLYEGLILKEKEFRNTLKNFDWQQFKNHHIALCCSSEAIIPAWAFLLIQTHLHGIAKTVVFGTLEILETVLYTTIIENLDVSVYKDKPVIVKGCSDKAVPQNAYLLLSKKLQGVARSIMYGEACSAVPLFKKNKA
ncbi:DUF2480 family protein [Flavobacteriaceae bacterium]|nr:DUF2480 family protein [Flavobacteriaceae bacterium]MDB2632164.1 DUF2480 family protein [Flavobacteriaceae bacterium]CAI8424602.1 MAG: Uncharacterised protein [Formosa sp. Hel3_A1_48]